MRKIALALTTVALAVGFAGCADDSTSKSGQYAQVQKRAAKARAYIPQNGVELSNYNRAQKLYDTPNTIIWCTTTWGNPSSPVVTIPIAGKLTSSSVSYFPSQLAYSGGGDGGYKYNPELRSVDGMYHGSPSPYRYGFTPGGQYVDFSGMQALCTTSLTKFQRQNTSVVVTVDATAKLAQAKAESALAANDPKAAQAALSGLNGG